ncbi:MAG: EamA family transporter [Actinomycetota bacterium]
MTGGETTRTSGRAASAATIWIALATVYIVWGSTYLAIRVAVRTMPPLLMASTRFLIAGALLYVWAIRRGDRAGDRPTRAHWRSALIVGSALLLGGNGLVVIAEQTVDSGIASLLVATVPLWMVLMSRFALREGVSWAEGIGVVVGFAGVALLVQPGNGGGVVGPLLLVFASVSWAAGSLYARNAPLPARSLVGAAMQMLAGGLALGVAGIARGEIGDIRVDAVSLESVLGFLHLIVFGSLVGFTAYAWLLRVARTSLVSTYAYVNPVVAVLLGWGVLGEEITPRTLIAGLVIVAAVALIVSARSTGRKGAGRSSATTVSDGSRSRTRGSTERSRSRRSAKESTPSAPATTGIRSTHG